MSLITNWQRIDVFDEKIEWQKNLAIEVYNICWGIAHEFYKPYRQDSTYPYTFKDDFSEEDSIAYSYEYEDSVIKISARYIQFKHPERCRCPSFKIIKVYLLSPHTDVFSASYHVYYTTGESYEISDFRVGAWLNHIESLRLKLEPIKKAKEKAEEEAKKQEQQRRFGRL
jgi:hypothetical protein